MSPRGALTQKPILFICVSICLFALLVNTYVLLALQKSLSFSNFHSVFRDDLRDLKRLVLTRGSFIWHGDPVKEDQSPQEDDDRSVMPFLLQRNIVPGFVFGHGRGREVDIVIGIPSVRRPQASYLFATIESLVRNIYPNVENQTAIVVFIAEEDEEYIEKEARYIYGNFTREVNSGLLQIIGPPKNFYPDFKKLAANLGDSSVRTRWRSKEVVDAALLMFLCRHKARFYLMMEDDIVAIKGYMTIIRKFLIRHLRQKFLFLSFSSFQSIGNLFRTVDIPRWVSYLLTFYNEKPIDWLINEYVGLRSCSPNLGPADCKRERVKLVPKLIYGIFQHIGKQSSLEGKLQGLEDGSFRNDTTIPIEHHNPEAKISTSSRSFNQNAAESWYQDSGGMTKHLYVNSMNAGDTITFTFNSPQVIKRIFIRTGSEKSWQELRLCSSCVVLEHMPMRNVSPADREYVVCGTSDEQGNLECNPEEKIMEFRLRATKRNSNFLFYLIYVQT